MSNDGGDGDYSRPRRPNPETISYLRSLPLSLHSLNQEFSESDSFAPSLAAAFSAIEEIRNEVASLAGDEHASQIIELLAHMALPYSETVARVMLHSLSGYHLHLATHRYGSHVVQTILQLLLQQRDQDWAKHEDSPLTSAQSIPSLDDLIFGMVEELSSTASQLALHVCGSHVLRSLVCLLAGVDLTSTPSANLSSMDDLRRGRLKSKKKKKKKQAPELETEQNHAGVMELIYKPNTAVRERLSAALPDFVNALFQSQKHGDLQQMACHPSASPLLIISLRVITYAHCPNKEQWQTKQFGESASGNRRLGISKPQPQYELGSVAHELIKKVLCLENDDQVGDVIYGMSGEPRGSHVLETLLRISPDELYSTILERGRFVECLQEYVEHDVSNFVIQTLLNTVRTDEQAESLLKGIEKLILSGYIVDGNNRRGSVLWRAMELSANRQIHQESLLKALRVGVGVTSNKTSKNVDETGGTKEEDDGDGKKKRKKARQKSLAVPLKDCIVPLLKVEPPESDGARVKLDVECCRAVYHLMRFTPRLIGDFLNGVVSQLSVEELEWIGKDGLGSRCIFDGILEGPMNETVFSQAARKLLEKLAGRWVALACDRVGHHSVVKVFKVLPNLDDKAVLTAELAKSSNRLGGSAMGRAVMEACFVREFQDSKDKWSTAVRRADENVKWLDELVSEPASSKKKRKRKRKSNDHSSNNAEKKTQFSAIDVIMDTITSTESTKAAVD